MCLQGAADVYDHQVSISAPWYLPVDQSSIPTGEALVSSFFLGAVLIWPRPSAGRRGASRGRDGV